jgi:hypothetical protein
MIETFPPLNGPLAKDENIDNPKTTDYGLNRTYVYACFAWSQADAAHKQTVQLAEKHRVGFFNVSSDEGDVWVPGARGKLEELKE